MNPVTVIAHPLVQHNLTKLRDQRTEPEAFRRGLGEVAALMVYEATRSFETRPISVKTPLTRTTGAQLKREVILIPILRAGLGMLNPILQLVPHARVGFIFRAESLVTPQMKQLIERIRSAVETDRVAHQLLT